MAKQCNQCKGTGQMKCPRCDATGEIQKRRCYFCQGERYVTCTLCRGEKYIKDQKIQNKTTSDLDSACRFVFLFIGILEPHPDETEQKDEQNPVDECRFVLGGENHLLWRWIRWRVGR